MIRIGQVSKAYGKWGLGLGLGEDGRCHMAFCNALRKGHTFGQVLPVLSNVCNLFGDDTSAAVVVQISQFGAPQHKVNVRPHTF
jgi:hypothetical protein